MSAEDPHRNAIEVLADSFVQRYRRGERPSLAEYAQKHPDLADEIRQLFPALVLMEQFGPPVKPSEGRESEAPTDAAVPRQLGDYRILREVGRGGMGIVYEAEQESLGRHVALKVLPFHSMMDATYLKRFRREARAAARLHHTNIVPVFSVGEHQGVHYYAMQFIQGQSLDEVLAELKRMRGESPRGAARSGSIADMLLAHHPYAAAPAVEPSARACAEAGAPAADPHCRHQGSRDRDDASSGSVVSESGLSTRKSSRAQYFRSVARIGAQASDALAYAHTQGILHRDIKPSNLLLDTRGTVWVSDFGLAKGEECDSVTETGDIVGTLRYMAPERLKGWADPRSDIYSLGLTLYELLTLRPAFEAADKAQLVQQLTQAEPAPPRRLDRQVPRDLETIVLKATAKEPSRRYQTATDLAEDLRRFLTDKPIDARRPTLFERMWRLCRRNRLVASLTASIVALVVLGSLAAFSAAVSYRKQRDVARGAERGLRVERTKTLASLARAEAAELEKADQLRQAYLAQAQAGRRAGRAGRRFDGLEAVRKAASIRTSPELELRNEAIACLALVDLRDEKVWPASTPLEWTVALDPALERYTTADAAGNMAICAVEDQATLVKLHGPGQVPGYVYVRFGPDGHFVAAEYFIMLGQHRLMVWDSQSGKAVLDVAAEHWGTHLGSGFDFSPDGGAIAVGEPGGTIGIFHLADHQPARHLTAVRTPGHMAFHPDGHHLAVTQEDPSAVVILDTEDRAGTTATFPLPNHPGGLAWGDDGRLLAAGCQDGRIYRWDVAAHQELTALLGHHGHITEVSFNHAGNLLASSSWDGTTRLWDPVTGKHLVSASGGQVRFGRDDRSLAFTRSSSGYGLEVGIWEGAEARECLRLHHGQVGNLMPSLASDPSGVDFSPDGSLLVSANFDGARLWDAKRARQVAYLPIDTTTSVVFQPDGRSLITYGTSGVVQWPLAIASEGALEVGPPEAFDVHGAPNQQHACWDGSGRLLAMTDGAHAQALVRKSADLTSEWFAQPWHSITRTVLSPDGRWAAAGSWRGSGVRIWEVASGAVVQDLPGSRPDARSAVALFSPDGAWLAVSGQTDVRFWHVGSWQWGWSEPLDRLAASPPAMAFSPDGQLLAIARSLQTIELYDMASRRAIAHLEGPDPVVVAGLCFSPDGSQLAMATSNHIVYIWELRVIRAQLAAMGLDWTAPEFPPDELARSTALPRVNVRTNAEFFELRARMHERRRDFKEALGDFQRALDLEPDRAAACNGAAWIYATGPAAVRSAEKAEPLARRAVQLKPDNWNYRNTLGVVQYRLDQFAAAVETLELNLRNADNRALASDLLFLAMAYHRLGQADQARSAYDRGSTWLTGQVTLRGRALEELNTVRAEAEALLTGR